jgi:uncharacterized protein with NAD-binding domain and iron-sulfur cluster
VPTKVAILGGGMGSLAAAWKLSDPALGGAFDVTVYQRDGLLGGKGASTRSPDPQKGGRIQEHGIHMLMGFYDNALSLLEECYAELAPAGSGTGALPWDDALMPWDEVTLAAETPSGWDFQKLSFPTNALPFGGDGTPAYVPALFANALGWFVAFLSKLGLQVPLPPAAQLEKLVVWLVKLLVFLGQLGLPVAFLFGLVKWWVDAVVKAVWKLVSPLVAVDAKVRWLWCALWFIGTNLRGMIDEGILASPHDFSVMDGQDYKVWLDAQSVVAAPPELSWDSPPVRAAYDIAFSFGHPLEAGTVLYNLLLIALGYKQHFAYKMNAGMGEVVFTPLHHALVKRGVQFEFYHTVTKVGGAVDGSGELAVNAIEISVAGGPASPFQAETVELDNGSPRTLDTWTGGPASALAPQTKTLVKGTDFDLVVLGISVGALGGICAELASQDPGFQQMLSLQTLPTQSAQLWLDDDLAQLGWNAGPASLVSFARPFNSWLDMAQVSKREKWTTPPAGIAYFSDEYAPDSSGALPEDVVWQRLVAFVTQDLPSLWPGFSLESLRAPTGTNGLERLKFQYWRANLDASDRYVIPAVGTNALRLAEDGTKFKNLALAGDWVRTHLNTGCLEAATTAGFAAAAAILDGRVHS